MDFILNILFLVAGFILLIKGADWFVDGSSSVARLLRVPSVIVGLTIVSIGTSAPEAAVSITGSLSGSNEIAISNVIGSNLFNLLIVIGACAILKPFVCQKDIVKRDLPINILITVFLFLLLSDGQLSLIEGIALLVLTVLYILLLIKDALKNREDGDEIKIMSPAKSILFIAIGIVAIVLGGDWVVDSAKSIAVRLGMSDTLVGLTIVAMGTSLPELVTSMVAAKKGESGLALGNAVGSCIFNILLILGLSATLSPIKLGAIPAFESFVDTIVLVGVTALVYIFCRTKDRLSRLEGVVFVASYLVYLAYAIMRTYNIL